MVLVWFETCSGLATKLVARPEHDLYYSTKIPLKAEKAGFISLSSSFIQKIGEMAFEVKPSFDNSTC